MSADSTDGSPGDDERPDRAPWNLSPSMLRHRAVCSYAQAVLDALPNARGERSPAAVAWVEVIRAHVESFDVMA